jgi:hypothetical protein
MLVRYMARDFPVDPAVEQHSVVTHLLCGLIFCDACKGEPVYPPETPGMSDKHRHDRAVAMRREGWIVLPDGIRVLRPECAAARRAN